MVSSQHLEVGKEPAGRPAKRCRLQEHSVGPSSGQCGVPSPGERRIPREQRRVRLGSEDTGEGVGLELAVLGYTCGPRICAAGERETDIRSKGEGERGGPGYGGGTDVEEGGNIELGVCADDIALEFRGRACQ